MNNLRNSFLEKGISLKDSWLNSVYDSGSKTYDSIFAILKDTDISLACEPSPLPDISRKPKVIYQGENVDQNFKLSQIFLQINEVIDISLPLEKRRALERSEKSTLKILMTDGITNFVAISKKPITSFSTDITPGSKIFIKIPIESRYGVIFLSEEKILFLKGKSQQVIDHRNHIYSKSSNQSKNQRIQPKPDQVQKEDIHYLSDSNDDNEISVGYEEDTEHNNNDIVNDSNQFIDSSAFSDDIDSQFLDETDDIEELNDSDFDKLPSLKEKHINPPKSNSNPNINYITDSSDGDVEYDEISTKNKKFLSVDYDDFDVDPSSIDQNNSKNILFSVNELRQKKNLPQPECFETVKTFAKIVDCSDFQYNEKELKNCFTLNVMLKDPSGEIKVKVDPVYIMQVIQMEPKEFLNLNFVEMEKQFPKIKNYFTSLNPPFTLNDGGTSDGIRYTLIEST